MAMNKKNVLLWGIGIIGVGVGGYLLFKRFKKKKGGNGVPPVLPPNPVNTTTNPPTSTQINASGVPFTNSTEGNAFRGWINDTYPTYASQIDLDRTGSYNNSYITKAWNKYGATYSNQNSAVKNKVVSNINTQIAAGGGGGLAAAGGNIISSIFGTKDGYSSAAPQVSSFSAAPYAKALYDSMKGWGTNEAKFFNTMDALNPAQRSQVETYFNNNLGEGETLEVWIRGDFSGNDLQKALGYIS